MTDLAAQPVHNPIPYLSVIIPIYNGEADLPGLLACLTAQTYPRDRVEYLIVDNGSTDDTFATLRRHRATLCIADSEDLTTPTIATAPTGYLRLRRDHYSPADIRRWAAVARETTGWRRVYVYFKHEDEGRGPRFAQQFLARLNQRGL